MEGAGYNIEVLRLQSAEKEREEYKKTGFHVLNRFLS
jgi:hypothetical protein